jgi:ATP-dependent helicase YprA (DUF1998 family)
MIIGIALVVDELHTFDGAQGTDLACLIRRVKHRLGVAPGQLVCVGTSATLGGEGTAEALLDYARAVFGEPFAESGTSAAVVAEYDAHDRRVWSADWSPAAGGGAANWIVRIADSEAGGSSAGIRWTSPPVPRTRIARSSRA